jgi:hypothetical protein
MTMLLIWRERDLDRFWMVSDSRLSSPGQIGRHRLTDRGAKILEAPLVLRRPSSGSVLGTPIRETMLGFAFTGSSLTALQSYSAVLPLWNRLQTSGLEILPSIRDCAEHLSKFVRAYFGETEGACECVLIGYDDPSHAVDGWVVEANLVGGQPTTTVRQLRLSRPGAIESLGSGRAAAREGLLQFGSCDGERIWQREPLHMIRHLLKSDLADDVGGGVQLGFLTELGFQLNFDVQPFTCESPICERVTPPANNAVDTGKSLHIA